MPSDPLRNLKRSWDTEMREELGRLGALECCYGTGGNPRELGRLRDGFQMLGDDEVVEFWEERRRLEGNFYGNPEDLC